MAVHHGSIPKGFSIKAAEIHHIPELQCFGYSFTEPTSQPRSINVEMARSLGVTSNKKFRMLKSGFPVMNDDESQLVHSHEVCGEPIRPRKITVLGDCCLVPPAMEHLSMNSDVLIHEATLSKHDTGKKAQIGGHSTSAQAAIFANKVKAQVLILNHLPKQLNTYNKSNEWLYEAESRIDGPTKVQLGYDHLEILIPRNGFHFSSEKTRSLWPDQRMTTSEMELPKQSDQKNRRDVPTSVKMSELISSIALPESNDQDMSQTNKDSMDCTNAEDVDTSRDTIMRDKEVAL